MNITSLSEAFEYIEAFIEKNKTSYARYNIHNASSDDLHFMVMGMKAYSSALWHSSRREGEIFYEVIDGILEINEIDFLTHAKVLNKTVTSKSLPLRLNKRNWIALLR